jgi:hypothetical protein
MTFLKNTDFSTWGPITVLVVLLTGLTALGGLLVVILHPDTLTFEQYLDDLSKFVVGAGLLGIGRGVHAAARASSLTGDAGDDKSL